MGRANSFIQIVVTGAYIFSSTVLYQANNILSQGNIYVILSVIIILIGFFLIYGVKDVIKEVTEKEDREYRESLRNMSI